MKDKEVQVRVLSFLEGTLIGDMEDKSQIDYFLIGQFIGQMNRRLSEFSASGLEGRETTDEWSMFQMPEVVDKYSQYV